MDGSVQSRSARLSLALIVIGLMVGLMTFSAPQQANAQSEIAYRVCQGYLDPAWTGTYRCDAPDYASGYGLDWALITTYERAGCVDYADVWHNLINSWACYSKGTEFGGIAVRQDGGWYRGVIRNNNLTYRGNFWLADDFK
jgi:hypothetical protein